VQIFVGRLVVVLFGVSYVINGVGDVFNLALTMLMRWASSAQAIGGINLPYPNETA